MTNGFTRKTRPDTRLLIGYWHAAAGDGYSHPQPLEDPTWEAARRRQIVGYLRSGFVFAGSGGHSYCRFGCTQDLLERADEASGGQYLTLTRSYVEIVNGVQKTRVVDESGYYVKRPFRLLNGCYLCCDDVWCWPDGLAHYVEVHGLRLPDEFVAHAVRRQFEPGPRVARDINQDDEFWRAWSETNAPFRYEPGCLACTSGR